MIAPDTIEHHKRMCRIFLFEAHRTIHRDWAFTLLNWCAESRMRAMELARRNHVGLYETGRLF